MINPSHIHEHLAMTRTREADCGPPPVLPPMPGRDLAPLAGLLAGTLGLLLIAAPSL
jgi:hypothetical protein